MAFSKMDPIFLLLLVSALNGCIAVEEPDVNLLVSRASREIDLSSSVVKQSVTFTFQNEGTNSVSFFLFVVDANLASQLAYISAEVSSVIYIYNRNFSFVWVD